MRTRGRSPSCFSIAVGAAPAAGVLALLAAAGCSGEAPVSAGEMAPSADSASGGASAASRAPASPELPSPGTEATPPSSPAADQASVGDTHVANLQPEPSAAAAPALPTDEGNVETSALETSPAQEQEADDAVEPAAPADGTQRTSSAAAAGDESPALSPAGSSDFDIELVFDVQDELDPVVEAAFEAARDRWQEVIVGDLEDFTSQRTRSCDGFEVPASVDDLIIFVTLGQIDGPDGILGAAGPCLVRGSGQPLPFAGRMQFDAADLLRFAEEGRLEEIVLHEMGHVLGIGALWQLLELLEAPATGQDDVDTAFIGPLAAAHFDAVGGSAYAGAKVPVENSGGEGVANGHWRESVFGNELMTPFMSDLPGLLSDVTIASLEDLRYEVSYSAADGYSWPPQADNGQPLRVAGRSTPSFELWLQDDVLRIPVYAVDADGSERRVQ